MATMWLLGSESDSEARARARQQQEELTKGYRRILAALYRRHCPEKLPEIGRAMQRYSAYPLCKIMLFV